MRSGQLPLALQLRDEASFDNFFIGANQTVFDCLKTSLTGHGEQFVYLWGEPGSGRTHLLEASCQLATEQHKTAVYLPLSEHATLSPSALQGLQTLDVVCLDDIDSIAGFADWEEALFHLYNQIRESQTRLIIAGNVAPRHLLLQLADLVSRLSWGVVFHLQNLSEDDLQTVLQSRADARGIQLSDEVASFLLKRYQRDSKAILKLLDELDKASLAEKRRVTIPFVKEVLGV